MAQHDSSHSSKDRTILWIILPFAIGISLLFTRLNHNMSSAPEAMSSDFSQAKKEVKHEAPAAHHEEPAAAPADATHMVEGAHDAAPAGEHAPAHH